MKMQLALALFCCLLRAVHCLFGVNVAMEVEPDDFCDEGPPGRYCLLDLSGWHDCHVDHTTGKMLDTIYSCAPNTRCACFYGPSCPDSLSNPCQPYKLPPPTPDKFTVEYNFKQQTCSPSGCHDRYSSGRELQSLTEEKKRDDEYVEYWSSTFVRRGNGSKYVQTRVRWDEQKCESQEIEAFPETEIPPYFSYNGTVRLGYRMCEQWIWKTGGHNAGQGTTLTAFYIYNSSVPVMMEAFAHSSPMAKTTIHQVENFTSFNRDVNETLFELPSFCNNETQNLQSFKLV